MEKPFIKFSPSLIGYLLECPRCLWLHFNEDIKRPRGLFPSLPDGMDDIFKRYFDSYRGKKELPPELYGKINARLFEDLSRLELWRSINFGNGGLSAEFPEYRIILRGAIDELLVNDKGHFIPLDFKTRGYPTKEDSHQHYQHQLDLYALLLEANDLPIAEYGCLLFFWPLQYESGLVKFGTELIKVDLSIERAHLLLGQVRDIVDAPIPDRHEACEYCLYRERETAQTT